MGKAIIINGMDFSSVGIGQVTPSQYRALHSIVLSEGMTEHNNIGIDVAYTPNNATYKELEWSIESGSQYAAINNGVLTVLEGADNDTVTVKAASTYDSSIYDTLTLNVTYQPSTYDAEVLYLETDGTAYIDTGVNTSSDTQFDIKMYLPHSSASLFPFGARKIFNANSLEFYLSIEDAQYGYRYGNSSHATKYGNKPKEGYIEINNMTNNYTAEYTCESISDSVICQDNTFDTGLNFFLFLLNDEGSPRQTSPGIKIYACKLYNNGVLVRDFIPVRKDGVGYLYDKISEELFGNAADSGSFLYGNDITPGEINEHGGLMFDGASSIDTGIAVKGSHKIELDLTLNFHGYAPKNLPNDAPLGGRDSVNSNRRDIQIEGTTVATGFIFGIGNSSEAIRINTVGDHQRIVLKSYPTYVAIGDGTTSVSISDFTGSVNYYVGCQNQIASMEDYYCIYHTIHSLKIWDSSDNLIAHFVPATYQGESGLYDKVGNIFHENTKSGTLLCV